MKTGPFDKFKNLISDITNGKFSTASEISEAAVADKKLRKSYQQAFERAVISDIKSKFEERKRDRLPQELKWRLNINYYNGDQFTRISNIRNEIVETEMFAEWEERNVYNEISPKVETRFAILSKRRNHMKNRPASSSSEDRTSAKIGNKVLASTRSRLRMSELSQEANLIAGVMGTAIWKTTWDSSLGNIVGLLIEEKDREEKEITPLQAYEKELLGDSINLKSRYIREGDVNTTLHSPFEIYPENPTKPLRDNQRVMHVVLMSPEQVFEKWGVIEKGTDNETFKIISSNQLNYGGAISGRTEGYQFGISTQKNTVRVYEEHEMPSATYPHGRLIICTDNHLLYYGSQPDALGENDTFEFCFDIQQSVKTDGFFGRSVVERLIPIQDKYNAVKNRKQDYLNRLAIGVIVFEEGSLSDEEELRTNGIAPGDMIAYAQNSNPPKYMEIPPLPQSLENEERDLLSSFNRVAGVSQLAEQSTTPINVVSGTAIAGLAEQDDTRIGLEAENIRTCIAGIGRKWLILYQHHVMFTRMVKEIGRNDEFEIGQFVGSDLTSFDVFVEPEPEASDTLSQRRQKVVELLNSGLFNDTKTGNITEEGRVKIFEMLELGNWEDFVTAEDAQQRRAERENNAMVAGDRAVIRSFDDDIVHIAKHNNFRLMAEYEERLTANPEIDEIFEAHISEHLHNLQMKNQADATQEGVDESGINHAQLPSQLKENETAFGDVQVK